MNKGESEMTETLDDIDMVILANLQKNGRMTNVDLSGIVEISAPPCLRRLRSLEQKGIIKGYHAEINPQKMGYKFKGIAIVRLKTQTAADVRQFLAKIMRSANVRSCFSTIADENFILHVISKDISDFENIIRSEIRSNSNVLSVVPYVMATIHKEEYGIPLQQSTNNTKKISTRAK
jgi:DNA-binding Lrp family transcriptional regulator